MRESEKATERYLFNRVKKLGGKAYKFVPMHDGGLPDRVCFLPGGVVFFVETKSQGDKPSKLQIIKHRELRALGFKVFVADTKKQIDEILNAITR